MSLEGVFDPLLVSIAWFDDTAVVAGWFDPDLISSGGGPPPAPQLRLRMMLGVGL